MLDDAMGTVCLGYDTALLTINMAIGSRNGARGRCYTRIRVRDQRKNLIHLAGGLTRGDGLIAKAQCNVLVSGKRGLCRALAT